MNLNLPRTNLLFLKSTGVFMSASVPLTNAFASVKHHHPKSLPEIHTSSPHFEQIISDHGEVHLSIQNQVRELKDLQNHISEIKDNETFHKVLSCALVAGVVALVGGGILLAAYIHLAYGFVSYGALFLNLAGDLLSSIHFQNNDKLLARGLYGAFIYLVDAFRGIAKAEERFEKKHESLKGSLKVLGDLLNNESFLQHVDTIRKKLEQTRLLDSDVDLYRVHKERNLVWEVEKGHQLIHHLKGKEVAEAV